MNVSKLLVGSTLLIVVATLAGSLYYPNATVMNFAATSAVYDAIRVVLIGLLVTLLVTHPPRSVTLRAVLGAWAIGLMGLSAYLLFTFRINLIDITVFAELAIIFAIEALEPGVAPADQARASNVKMVKAAS